jgi:hypothetical protein
MAALNNWGAIFNETTGVHVHIGFDHLTKKDVGIGKNKSEKWDQPSGKYGDKDVTPFRFFAAKQFIINNLAVEDIISKVASDRYNKPHNFDNLDDACKAISKAKDFDELFEILQERPDNETSRERTINMSSYKNHGTIELRRMISKNSVGLGVDPNIVGRGISFAQQMMATTMDQVKNRLPDAPDGQVILRPAENVAQIANSYVQDITLFEATGALNHIDQGLRLRVMDNIVGSGSLISPDVLATINAMQKEGCFPENDPVGEHFIKILNGKENWNPQSVIKAQAKTEALKKTKPLSRKISTRELGGIAQEKLRIWSR